ncbi:MAG: exo-alpha-sialidase [Chloroflexi bacterium]|nr:exo-alpha-sialidase [Chloroflexota bacterium]
MSASPEQVHITLSQPVTVALAPPEVQDWGPYQFPGLARLPDGRMQVSFHVEADSATAYGLPPARAISTDTGKTWTLQPREVLGSGTALSWGSSPLHLPNGDWLSVKQLRPQPAAGLKLPAQPAGMARNYRFRYPCYRVEDLPPECTAGWMLYRRPAGQTQWVEEQATVTIPGEVRCVAEELLVFPWFYEMFLAPDGAVWAVNHNCRIAAGQFQEQSAMVVLRSTDGGRSFAFWSEIPYTPDAAADPQAANRDGFTEPTVCFMPNGSVFCLLRTTDGEGVGPMYWARSTDNGQTWSRPAIFDDLGVWPQMLALKNGVTLAVYGRPGLYVRATPDPAGLHWEKRVTVVEPDPKQRETCAYAALLPLNDHTALLAYSNFNLRNAAGQRCKGIQVRQVAVSQVASR